MGRTELTCADCHYHYSISFANKCVGCETAILKQFVEINRNGRDECWHPECYMIHKFWNVRLASRNFTTPASATPASSSLSLLEMSSMPGAMPGMSPQSSLSANASPGWDAEMSAKDLKERQIAMELKVSQIWLVLSGFEESSAACIGDMLRVVNERKLLDVILLAEKFILHVETLFAVIDDLEAQFALAGVKGKFPITHGRCCNTDMRRNVSCEGGEAALPQARQLLLDAVSDLPARQHDPQHAGVVDAGDATRSLPQDPHPHCFDRCHQAR